LTHSQNPHSLTNILPTTAPKSQTTELNSHSFLTAENHMIPLEHVAPIVNQPDKSTSAPNFFDEFCRQTATAKNNVVDYVEKHPLESVGLVGISAAALFLTRGMITRVGATEAEAAAVDCGENALGRHALEQGVKSLDDFSQVLKEGRLSNLQEMPSRLTASGQTSARAVGTGSMAAGSVRTGTIPTIPKGLINLSEAQGSVPSAPIHWYHLHLDDYGRLLHPPPEAMVKQDISLAMGRTNLLPAIKSGLSFQEQPLLQVQVQRPLLALTTLGLLAGATETLNPSSTVEGKRNTTGPDK
jgi:hypothetical protein